MEQATYVWGEKGEGGEGTNQPVCLCSGDRSWGGGGGGGGGGLTSLYRLPISSLQQPLYRKHVGREGACGGTKRCVWVTRNGEAGEGGGGVAEQPVLPAHQQLQQSLYCKHGKSEGACGTSNRWGSKGRRRGGGGGGELGGTEQPTLLAHQQLAAPIMQL